MKYVVSFITKLTAFFVANIVLATGFVILIFILLYVGGFAAVAQKAFAPKPTPTVTLSPTAIPQDIHYQGKNGVDALTLLRQNTKEEDKNGFVTSINGRQANEGKHEFWAFYVNGKFSDVGASDYKTHDTDFIEWRIQTY